MSERLLTARQVGDMFGVTSETVLRWARAGELPAIRLPGTARGRLRFRVDEIDRWLEEHATAAPVREAPTALSDAADGRLTFPVPTVPPHTAASIEED